jgi:hypothetical protein
MVGLFPGMMDRIRIETPGAPSLVVTDSAPGDGESEATPTRVECAIVFRRNEGFLGQRARGGSRANLFDPERFPGRPFIASVLIHCAVGLCTSNQKMSLGKIADRTK